MVSVGVNQVGRLNLGHRVGSLRYFTVCGQQEGYRPFAVNMARDPALWMSWKQPQFTSIVPDDPNLQVSLAVSFLLPGKADIACLVKRVAWCYIWPSGTPGSLIALDN